MDNFQKIIIAHNFGEKKAKLTYEVKEVTILGETYSVDNPGTTSEDLLLLLEEGYPFHITIAMTEDVLDEEVGISTITISLVWPYDQGDDALDTEWGEAASDFYKKMLQELNQQNENEINEVNEIELEIERGDIISVSVKIELKATQI